MSERVSDAAACAAPRVSRLNLSGLLWRAVPALLVIGTWLAFHPYRGVIHDSRLYTVQAFHWLHPEIFDRDLFFAFGSQDAFTLFSPPFAFLIEHLGLTAATILLTAIGHVLWLSGATALALRIVPDRLAVIVGLVLVAGLWPYYSGLTAFSYGEGFVTPRLFVEGLSLWAFYALICRHFLVAAGLMVPALLLHPIMAGATLCVGFTVLLFRDMRWGVLGLAGVAVVVTLAGSGMTPFDRLAKTVDPDWLAVLEGRNAVVFPSLWIAADWARLALAAAMALAAASLLAGWQRRAILAIVTAGLGGVLITYIGSDILRNVFVTQVQPYRTLWLLFPFAYFGTGLVLTRLWREEDGPGLVVLLMLACLVCMTGLSVPGAVLAIALLGLAVARLHGVVGPLPARARVVIYIVSGLLIGLLLAFRVFLFMHAMAILPEERSFWSILRNPTRLDMAAIAGLGGLLWFYRQDLTHRVLPAATVFLVLVTAGLWDRRDDWNRIVMADDLHTPFETYLAPDAQIYWADDVRGAWLVLKRPSYLSVAQGAAVVFTRGLALAYRDRAMELEPLGYEFLDTWDKELPPLPPLDRAKLVATCRAAPALDALVLPTAVEGSIAATWNLPTPIFNWRAARETGAPATIPTLYLYRCADLR
jgi:hypothetical protein